MTCEQMSENETIKLVIEDLGKLIKINNILIERVNSQQEIIKIVGQNQIELAHRIRNLETGQ